MTDQPKPFWGMTAVATAGAFNEDISRELSEAAAEVRDLEREQRMTDLKALDGAATQGVWAVGVDDSASQVTGFPIIATENYTIVGNEGMYGDFQTDFANAAFIVALVNAYRAGEPVTRQTAPEPPMTDPQRDPAPTLAAVMRLAQRGIVAEEQGGIWYVDGHPPMTTEAMIALSEGREYDFERVIRKLDSIAERPAATWQQVAVILSLAVGVIFAILSFWPAPIF